MAGVIMQTFCTVCPPDLGPPSSPLPRTALEVWFYSDGLRPVPFVGSTALPPLPPLSLLISTWSSLNCPIQVPQVGSQHQNLCSCLLPVSRALTRVRFWCLNAAGPPILCRTAGFELWRGKLVSSFEALPLSQVPLGAGLQVRERRGRVK